MQTIEVKGLGPINFPDGMSDDEIIRAIEVDLIGPSATDESSGFFNNFNLREINRAAKTDSGPAGIVKYLSGKNDKEVEESKKRAGFDVDPTERLLEAKAEAIYQKVGYDHPDYLAAEKDLDSYVATKDKKPEISFGSIKEAVNQDPGGVAAEFAKALVVDPELALTPLGWRRAAGLAVAKTAKYGAGVQKAAQVGGGAVGAGLAGGAVTAGISSAQQLGESGEIDVSRLGSESTVGALVSSMFGTVMAAASPVIGRAATRTGRPVEEALESFKGEINAGKSLDEALSRVYETMGVADDTAQAVDEIKAAVRAEIPSLDPAPPLKQAGKVDPKVAGVLALGGLGAAVGFAQEGDPLDAATGAAIGIGGAAGIRALYKVGRGVVKISQRALKEDNRIRINRLVDDWEANGETQKRATWQFQKSIEEMVPDAKRREMISHWVEGDKSIQLTAQEKQVGQAFKDFTEKLYVTAKEAGVLDGFLDDYVPHFWRHGGKRKSELFSALESRGGGMGTKSMHSKSRTIPTLKEGMEAGLVPETLDIAHIARKYGDSINRAIRNKKLIGSLREQMDPHGNKLVMNADDAPRSYEVIGHPQFIGQKVHPDIVPSLKFLFDSSDPNVATRALLAVNMASKRSLVSASFFHANALIESHLFASGIAGLKDVPGLLSGRHSSLAMLRRGGAGDAVDEALRAGLKIGTIDDVGADVFYAALKDVQAVADDFIPGASLAVKGIEKANRFVDGIMWDRIATGAKLTVFMKEIEKQALKSAARHRRNPAKYPLEPREAIARDVAEYVNDAFGGQNWRRTAEGIKSRYGRELMLAINSPSGRKAMQLALFAPDWTISNARILGRAVTQSTRVLAKHLTGRTPTQSELRMAKLHNMYAVRGAIFFLTAGDAINVMMSGHHIWENEDPTTIDMGDGRRMMFSKQFVEPFHWAAQPAKTLGNKLGVLPRSVFEFIQNKRWISPYGAPNIWRDNADGGEVALEAAKHVGSKFVPIAGQQIHEHGGQGVAGFFGHPILGRERNQQKRIGD